MNKMQLKKDDVDAFKKVAVEQLEEIVCTSLDVLDETMILIGYEPDGKVFDKDSIDEFFELINEESVREMHYINGSNKQEIKIQLKDNRQFILLNIG